jgi:carboxyl-terminal processing protease
VAAQREHADAPRKLLLAAAAAVGLAASFAAGHLLGAGAVRGDGDRAEQVRRQVLAELALHYYEPLPDSLPSDGSVAGLVAALGDPHTRYLPPRAFRALARAENAQHGGIGVRVGRDRAGRGLLVTRVLAGLPAADAGVRAGDVITRIDGRLLRDLAHRERVELLAGPVGAGIRVEVVRRGRDPGALSLVRRALTAPPLESRTLAGARGRYLVVRVAGFAARTARAVHVLARRAAAQRYAGMVIDVRGNPGGLLAEGVAAVRTFLERGVIVRSVGRSGTVRVYRARGAAVSSLPLAVVADRSTASAAEVFAGALRAHGRAVIVGTRTYGKGTVQSVRPLADGGALKLTVARLLLPAGMALEGVGLRPDVRAVDRPATARDEALTAAVRALAAR